MRRSGPTGAMLVIAATLAVAGCGRDAPEPGERDPENAKASSTPRTSTDEAILPDPVDVEDAARPLHLNIYSRAGYRGPDGTVIIDVLEGDLAYATLLILDARGRPVRGVLPTVTPERDSRYVPMTADEVGSGDLGNYRFGLLGGTMGEERVEVAVDGATVSLFLNVISRRASGYEWLAEIEGILDWRQLLEAEVTWGDEGVSASIPEEIRARSGETVRLVGFVMPLEATLEQKHFLLTSSPPGCFFHVPGGAAGAVEIFASEPLSLGFDPVVFEGRFEALESGEDGVIYRLHEARLLDPPRRSPDR